MPIYRDTKKKVNLPDLDDDNNFKNIRGPANVRCDGKTLGMKKLLLNSNPRDSQAKTLT